MRAFLGWKERFDKKTEWVRSAGNLVASGSDDLSLAYVPIAGCNFEIAFQDDREWAGAHSRFCFPETYCLRLFSGVWGRTNHRHNHGGDSSHQFYPHAVSRCHPSDCCTFPVPADYPCSGNWNRLKSGCNILDFLACNCIEHLSGIENRGSRTR